MISITKEEAVALRNKFSDLHIAITNRHKKSRRKHYYTEETNRVLYFLERLRNPRDRRRPDRGNTHNHNKKTNRPRHTGRYSDQRGT